MPRGLVVGLALGLACNALQAQTNARFVIMVSGEVSPASPEATVEVWAAWDQPNPGVFAFGAGDYDLVADAGAFTSAGLLLGRNPPNSAGTPLGNRVVGAAMGQLVCVPVTPPGPSRANPIALATYTWTTTSFAPRTVDIFTDATTTFVLEGPGGCANYVSVFVPGSASIRVTPTPGVFVVLSLAGLCAAKRRR